MPRVFQKFPKSVKCPICGTNRDGECWLMEIDGTDDGNNVEAVAVHTECTGRFMMGGMRYNREYEIVYYSVKNTINL